ncbi:MAG: hypothetical protein MJ252_12920 [archaeon]|nr:hypothetical protein [archaeon]
MEKNTEMPIISISPTLKNYSKKLSLKRGNKSIICSEKLVHKSKAFIGTDFKKSRQYKINEKDKNNLFYTHCDSLKKSAIDPKKPIPVLLLNEEIEPSNNDLFTILHKKNMSNDNLDSDTKYNNNTNSSLHSPRFCNIPPLDLPKIDNKPSLDVNNPLEYSFGDSPLKKNSEQKIPFDFSRKDTLLHFTFKGDQENIVKNSNDFDINEDKKSSNKDDSKDSNEKPKLVLNLSSSRKSEDSEEKKSNKENEENSKIKNSEDSFKKINNGERSEKINNRYRNLFLNQQTTESISKQKENKNFWSTEKNFQKKFSLDPKKIKPISLKNRLSYSLYKRNKTNTEKQLNELNLKIDKKNFTYNKIKEPKISNHEIGKHIKAYGVNSYKSVYKEKNLVKVSIILAIQRPKDSQIEEKDWPNISFFGLYESPIGSKLSNFLRDDLHNYVIKNQYFPADPKNALIYGFIKSYEEYKSNKKIEGEEKIKSIEGEEFFIGNQNEQNEKEILNSTSLVGLLVDDTLYIAFIGDGDVIISKNGGSKLATLKRKRKESNEGTPSNISVKSSESKMSLFADNISNTEKANKYIFNSRMDNKRKVFNNFRTKSKSFHSSRPESHSNSSSKNILNIQLEENKFIPKVHVINLSENLYDFLLIGNAGLFTELTKESIGKGIIQSLNEIISDEDSTNDLLSASEIRKTIHNFCGFIVNELIKKIIIKGSKENLTCILILFDNFAKIYNDKLVKIK